MQVAGDTPGEGLDISLIIVQRMKPCSVCTSVRGITRYRYRLMTYLHLNRISL